MARASSTWGPSSSGRPEDQSADGLSLRGEARAPVNAAGRPVNGTPIAVLGVSYKPGVADVREAPALKIPGLLSSLGADLCHHDPFVSVLPSYGLLSEPLEDVIAGADLAVIVTARPGVDHEAAVDGVPLVLDLRGVTRAGRGAALL